jgi:Uma2 family endonuclease
MSPSADHERIKSILGHLVETFCVERDIDFRALGSWTLKHMRELKGLEPDECYIFGDHRP